MPEQDSQIEELRGELAELRREVQTLREAWEASTRRVLPSLRESLRCPACGGTTILHVPQVLDRAEGGAREAMALVQPSVWRSRTIGEVELYFCRGCGLAEWYVKDPGTIEADGEKIREIDASRGPVGDAYR